MKAAFIHLTNACNLKCFHCAYASGAPFADEISFDDLQKVAQMIASRGGKNIMLGGGEPLLRRDIEAILDMIASYNLSVKLETNLTANQSMIKKLVDYKNIVVITSIDSMHPEVHDRQRGRKGSFERTYRNVLYLRDQGVPVRINAMMLRTNKDDVEQYLTFAEQTGAVFRPLFRLIATGRSVETHISSLALEALEIQAILERLFQFARSPNKRALVSFYLPPALVPPDLVESRCMCDWGNFIGIAADKTLALCPAALGIKELTGNSISEYTSGRMNLEDTPFIKNAKAFDTATLQGVCHRCIVRNICRGGCRVDAYVTYHSLNAPDPMCEAFYQANLFPAYALDEDHDISQVDQVN